MILKIRFWGAMILLIVVVYIWFWQYTETNSLIRKFLKESKAVDKGSRTSEKITPPEHSSLPAGDYLFPEGFLWGVATSAFQNEGGFGKTDWDEWPPYLKNGHARAGFTEKDIIIAKNLGIKSIRFSIEWALVEPEDNVYDKEAIDRYVYLASFMLKNGIEPFVCLNHLTLPARDARRGGWENDELAERFGRYAKEVASAFKPLEIKYWMTINEPTVIMTECYINGTFPPNRKEDLRAADRVRDNLATAHRRAYKNIHQVLQGQKRKPLVGIAHLVDYREPDNPGNSSDQQATAALDSFLDSSLMSAIKDQLDYVGLNYYHGWKIKSNRWSLFLGTPVEFIKLHDSSVSGKEFYAEGLYRVVKGFRRYRKPIIITENGIDDNTDEARRKFILNHLIWLHRAIEEDNETVPVIGYFYWTLFDNFEWSKGLLEPSHFGLMGFNPETKERVPRPSAGLFRDIISANGIKEEFIFNNP